MAFELKSKLRIKKKAKEGEEEQQNRQAIENPKII